MDLPTPFLSEATYLCLLPIILYFIHLIYMQIYKKVPKDTKAAALHENAALTRKWKIAALLLSALYIIMSSATEVLKGYGFESLYHTTAGYLLKLLLIAAGFLSCYFLICRLLKGFSFQPVSQFRKIGSTPIYLVMIPIALLSFFCIAGCYPGIVSSDSANSWSGVMGGYYDDWHPITYLYILKVIQKLFGLPYPIIIFQAVLWIVINQYALSLLEKHAPYRHVDTSYLIINLLMICSYRALGNLEKDTLWNLSVFLFSLCIFDFIKRKKAFPWYKSGLMLLSAWMTATIRHAGDAIVLITLFFLFLYTRNQKKKKQDKSQIFILVIMLSVLIVKFLLVNLLGFIILKAEPNEPYVKYSIPMSMIGAIAVKEQPADKELAVMETIMPLEKWQEYYDKYYADGISRSYGGIGETVYKLNDPDVGKDILKLNLRFLFQYPKTYLTAYFDMTSIVWEMGTPADGYEWMPISIYASTLELHPELSDFYIRRNISTTFQETIVGLSDKMPIWSSICWRGGFALFTLLLSTLLLIQKKRGEEALSLLPAFLLAVVLFLANPSQDPRYINSYQMLVCFFLLYAAYIQRVPAE